MERATIRIPSHDVNKRLDGPDTVIDYPQEAVSKTSFGSMAAQRYRMPGIEYQTLDDLKAAVADAKPPYRVLATAADAPPVVVQEGDEATQLVFEKTGGPLPIYRCITLVHPWWAENEKLPVREYPGLTQVTPQFVPGVSKSTDLNGAPVAPMPKPPVEPETNAPAPQMEPRAPVTHEGTLDFNPNGNRTVDIVDGVRDNDTIKRHITIPADFRARKDGLGTIEAVGFPAGGPGRRPAIYVDGALMWQQPIPLSDVEIAYSCNADGKPAPGVAVDVRPGQTMMLEIKNVGEGRGPGGVRLTVTAPPKA